MSRTSPLLALLCLTTIAAPAAELWRGDEPLANFHLTANYAAADDTEIEVIAAPDAKITFQLEAGRSGTIEIGTRQKLGELGEIGAWLDGEPLGDLRTFGTIAEVDPTGDKWTPPQFVSTEKQATELFEMGIDFSLYARFRTNGNGSLASRAVPGKKWLRNGKALFIRGGRLTYDVGWVGDVTGRKKVNDGRWHEAVVTSESGTIRLYLDGEKVAEDEGFARPDPDGTLFQIGAAGADFGGNFDGEISNVRFWKRALDAGEATLAATGKVAETNTPDFNWSPMPLAAVPPEAADEPKVIDGYLARAVTINGEPGAVKISDMNIGALAEADHARLVRAWDHNSLDRGARIYNSLCITCHGDQKIEGSLPTAMRFHKGEFKNGKDPLSLYDTLTKGYNQMVAQAWMTPRQKWDVIHYLRESFLKEDNPAQYTDVDDAYIASLPRGLGTGPDKPTLFGADDPKWKKMDYGPVQFWTIQVGKDNIAYKGIAVRLDEGPGGVAAGNKWMLYDHDTMRVAAAWEGDGYIDWRGIAFDQSHGSHASIVGEKAFENPVGPGVASPDGSYDDPRLLGRDGKPYGPLPREWTHYKGLYMHGNRPVLKYTVGEHEVLEMPGYESIGDTTVFTRTMTSGAGEVRIAPEGTAVTALGASVKIVDGFVVATPILYGNPCFKVYIADIDQAELNAYVKTAGPAVNLYDLIKGSPQRWPEIVTTEGKASTLTSPGFAADEITLPTENPWNSWMRLGGFDFFADGKRAAVATWLGDVFIVDGIDGEFGEHRWQRIATGLFQPLGVRIVDEKIHVTCRDQIAKLHDLNGDGEIDYIESFNNDHQVTEHFHEFAMGLQTDDDGNFYYAKSARHAKKAIVPHHGTLLKVSKDGTQTKIIANGFRAANGVCLNPDGTFIVTDQEGHWNPKNRINYVKEGGFYGNMFGYHDVTNESDEAMDQPLCWITNRFDRSPGELMWVPENAQWGPLNGSLLNLSYGTGKVFLVPHEKIDGQAQGGMISIGIQFPTGIMRGRFHPDNGQLYAIGMFAWAGSAQQDGGFYRIRHTGEDPGLPVELEATSEGVKLSFTGALDRTSIKPNAFEIEVWDLKRTKNYGSKHYDQRGLKVTEAGITADGTNVHLAIPDLKPTWGMSIAYELKSADGKNVTGELHNSIHTMPE